MKIFFFLLQTVFFFSAVNQQQNEDIFDQLRQLKGTWKTMVNGKTIFETWNLQSEIEMSGMSYKLNNSDTVIFERTRIVRHNKQISYIAKVANQNQGKEVVFKLVSSFNKTFIFENPEHDFPQRVAYQFTSSDSVHAWIDGKYEGKENREDYYYWRVK